MKIQLTISSITPSNSQSTTDVQLDGKAILSPDNSTYELTIQNSNQKQIALIIKNPTADADSITNISLQVAQEDVVGLLKTFPNTVGTSPFEVTLDATTVSLTDKDDEIIYFSRDFGNGGKNPNTSMGRVTYTYLYDEKKQNGTYNPTVTITTKK